MFLISFLIISGSKQRIFLELYVLPYDSKRALVIVKNNIGKYGTL
uniref:Uncharacterized protein n=1 Tax=Ciona intestinalis TaxID=7719 RepID=H2XN06_CIOIN